MHEGNYEAGHFSNEFKDLVTSLLMADPSKRLSYEEIANHPWMQIKEYGAGQVKEYFD